MEAPGQDEMITGVFCMNGGVSPCTSRGGCVRFVRPVGAQTSTKPCKPMNRALELYHDYPPCEYLRRRCCRQACPSYTVSRPGRAVCCYDWPQHLQAQRHHVDWNASPPVARLGARGLRDRDPGICISKTKPCCRSPTRHCSCRTFSIMLQWLKYTYEWEGGTCCSDIFRQP
jgi:hypothetical protein